MAAAAAGFSLFEQRDADLYVIGLCASDLFQVCPPFFGGNLGWQIFSLFFLKPRRLRSYESIPSVEKADLRL